jgi:5-methylcytosine-specific restriction endonuclease McrA
VWRKKEVEIMNKAKKSFIQNILRRGSYRWFTRWTAEKRTHIGRNEYYCEKCGLVGPKKSTQMDHVQAVVDPYKGFVGFDEYADRMYPDDEWGWMRLCKPCHQEKSNGEVEIRKQTRKTNGKKK